MEVWTDPWRGAASAGQSRQQQDQQTGWHGRGNAWGQYYNQGGGWDGNEFYMFSSTNPEQTQEISTVLNTLKEKFGGERETFDAKELLSIINSVSIIHKIYHSNAILKDGREGLLVDTGAVFNLT